MKHLNLIPTSLSLRAALLIYVVVPLISALGIAGYLVVNSFEKEVEQQMQNDLELVARAIQLPLSYALEKDRMGSVMQTLESVFSIGRVYSAYVYNKEGKEIATLGLTDPDSSPKRLTELAVEGERRGEYGNIAGREVYSYFVPLTSTTGQINGLLHLTRRGSDFNAHVRSIRVTGALSLFGLLFTLSGLFLYGHHRALGTHLHRLSSSMGQVASGERKHRFDQQGPKEISELGESFNHMLDNIERAEQELAERRRTQEKLENDLRQSEKLAALGRLAAGTAHELGSPLSVISGKAQRALRDKRIPPECSQTLVAIRREVTRMEYIIKQLLDFTRRGSFRCSHVRPAQLAASAKSVISGETETGKIIVKLTDCEDSPLLTVDAMRVEQALINLLRNAIQCSPDGTVCLSWQCEDRYLVFCVDDDGPGVPLDLRSKIFEPFFTTKQFGKGTGLGLAVVCAIADEHGGGVEVGESPLGGARFRFLLPLQASDEREADQ